MSANASDQPPATSLWLYVLRRVRRRILFALYQKRFTVLIGGVAMIAALGFFVVRNIVESSVPAVGAAPIAVSVQDLAPQGNSLPLVLNEKNGTRQLIIRDLESTEARVIAREQGIVLQGEQPRAYDLMRDLIQQTGARVDHVLVIEAERDQFTGRIVVSMGAETRSIRARPADAVALAVKTGAPIYVESAVLDRFGGRTNR
jgi:bifunctional DNase/RNase